MQDYEYMYEVCLCSVFWKIDHIWKTLFTRFKLMGRKRASVCPLRYDLMKTRGHASELATFGVNCTDTHW